MSAPLLEESDMTRVTLDEQLRQKLHNLTEQLELCDESGQVLAYVHPWVDYSQFEPLEPPHDEEELQRRETSDEPRYSLKEVMEYLER